MQSEQLNAISPNLPIATGNHADPCASHDVKLDTRRFAGIFPLEVPEALPVDCGDATHEKHDNDADDSDPSRWEFVSVLDTNASSTQDESVTNVDESSTLSAAQQIIACYRAVHGSDHASESAVTEIKELPQVPDDQRSMYTLATSTDAQSTMDMMWKPKPKIHMRRTDQRALIQAQTQAIAMMHNAGLKPTNKIQCRRRGCADILPHVEALKYHLHIHNIADTAVRCNDASHSATCNPSLVECRTPKSKTSKRSHIRSKSSLGTQQSCSTTYPLQRKLSAGCLLPSLFSPRESTPEVQNDPNLTILAAALVSDPGSSKAAGSLSVCNNNETPSTHTSIPSRGRRTRKESRTIPVGAEYNPSIAMLLSPPSPGMQGRLVLTQHADSPMPPEPNPVMDSENNDCVVIPNENAHSVSENLTRSRSPLRALSSTRAMSPIRNGIRRVLSIGYSVDFTDK